MKKIVQTIASAILLAIIASPAQAILSGFYDSAEQIKLILDTPEVADALRQMPIKSLERDDGRSDDTIKWEIKAEGCDLTIHLRPIPPAAAGKETYTIEVGEPCP